MKTSFFKQFKAASLNESLTNLIKGGIACDAIAELIEEMLAHDDPRVNEQANVVTAMGANGQIQCT
jgi:hypothetical protein